jgi:hypothetical protein
MADTLKFMTTREAAGYCRLHPASLALMRTQGIGPKFFRPADARRYLYREADLVNWIEGLPGRDARAAHRANELLLIGHDASRKRDRTVIGKRGPTCGSPRGGRT